MSRAEFGERYGASAADLQVVADFVQASGLVVEVTDAARRLVQASGTAEQVSRAFAVDLGHYRSPTEGYRGYEGLVYLPSAVADVVEAVLGLDNRRMAHRANTAGTAVPLTPPQVAQAYNFPTPADGASGETVAILEFSGPTTAPVNNPTCGFAQSDIDGFINYLNRTTGSNLVSTNVVSVPVDQSAAAPGNVPSGSADPGVSINDPDFEVVLDIEIVVSIAQHADVVVYFAPLTDQGWVDALTQIVADTTNDPSVLSISWGWAELETNADFSSQPFEWTQQAFNKMTDAFQSAAAIGMTVFVATGDHGSDCGVRDGRAHVIYPASDPWVTACGGTIVNSVSPLNQGTWNDGGGATGGGISYLVPPQEWQANANVPASANGDGHRGRGLPDVAGNASQLSGYVLWIYGQTSTSLYIAGSCSKLPPFGGTSAVAPLYAALIALINASLKKRVGYLNPLLYGAPGIFQDINDGVSNAVYWTNDDGSPGSSPGYNSAAGWDPCTGWGTIDGSALLGIFTSLPWLSLLVN
jgi:kumamolisin